MIAKFTAPVPFAIAVPTDAQYNLYQYEDEGYVITIYPPVVTDQPIAVSKPDSITVDGVGGHLANGVLIEFRKEQFDRSSAKGSAADPTVDPPLSLIARVFESFVTRLRYVTRGQMIPQLDIRSLPWALRYFNEDGSELEPHPDLVRGRFALRITFSAVTVSPAIWDDVYSLPVDFEMPLWESLRLDALAALPEIGTSVVLGFTALETFIAQILDALALHSKFAPPLWKWINEREHHNQEPSTADQFDDLLKHFTGHSLKEEAKLWTAFKNLGTARNKFVHEGRASIGGKPVDEATARMLVSQVDEIISWVRQWLPPELQWPTFDTTKVKLQFSHTILPTSKPG